MSSFIGGSAYAMANQIAEGYLLLNHTHLKKDRRNQARRDKEELCACTL